MAAPIKVFGVPFSVHTRKVILALTLKDIPHTVVPVVPVIPGNPPANWRSISPTGLIPAIDDDGFVLADSTAIVLYLERKVTRPALLPDDLQDWGRALALDAWAGGMFRSVVHPIFHQQVVQPKVHKKSGDKAVIDKALNVDAVDAFTYLEGVVGDRVFVGADVSIADLAVVSNLLVFHYLGHRVDAERFPRLAAYFQRHITAAPVRAVLEREKPFVVEMGLDRSFLLP